MKVYRNTYHHSDGDGSHAGFSWHPTKAEAIWVAATVQGESDQALEADENTPQPMPSTIAEPFDTGTTKGELIRFLNMRAEHPDNG